MVRAGATRREAIEDLAHRGAEEDADGNGTPDRSVCFRLDDLRALFADAPPGVMSAAVTIEGEVTGGGGFAAPLDLTIAAPAVRAQVSPNPMRRDGAVVLRTAIPGRVRVVLHDVRGRRVRVVHEGELPPGIHAFVIDARDASGKRLPSGVYFYRVETPDGVMGGRFTLLR
jgi:hypothetical protein